MSTAEHVGTAAPAGGRPRREILAPAGFAVVVALSAVLNIYGLSRNGYANIFYSAGVHSMLTSLHNFFFVSFDPGGLVTVDKPPLALWVQGASAELFGFSPLSLLLPEAIAGVLSVAAMYVIMLRRVGAAAAFAGALTVAVFPSFVAVSRDNGVDPVLILLMVLACWAGLNAVETGRWRSLLLSAVLVGLAFNTKTLAALLVVPGIAVAYLACAPGSTVARLGRLTAAGALMLLVSFSWIAVVELTPSSSRPYVGSSTNNTELGLTFEYNGFGRVEGQVGGPGRVPVEQGALAPSSPAPSHRGRRGRRAAPAAPAFTSSSDNRLLKDGRYENPIPFGGSPGPIRLFGTGLGDQAAWMLPFALIGMLALALSALGALLAARRSPPALERARRDPALGFLLIFGVWLAVEYIVLSTSKGIVHPYYVSALAPATGAMAGAGLVRIAQMARAPQRALGFGLGALAIAATAGVQVVLMHRMGYAHWFVPVLLAGAALAIGALALSRRLAPTVLALAYCLLLIMPAAYSASTWLAPVEGTFPAAGPRQAPGQGGYGIDRTYLADYEALIRYVNANHPGSTWSILTDASQTAAPVILKGGTAGAMGGYGGTDPALDGPSLARLVEQGRARYVVLGGAYSTRGGNRATKAVIAACREIAPSVWLAPLRDTEGLSLWDCAGRERELEAAG